MFRRKNAIFVQKAKMFKPVEIREVSPEVREVRELLGIEVSPGREVLAESRGLVGTWLRTINDYEAMLAQAILESLQTVNEQPTNMYIGDDIQQLSVQYPCDHNVSLRDTKFSGLPKECLLKQTGSAGEKLVRQMVHDKFGDRFTYLVDFRGDNAIVNPKTNKPLEADIAILQDSVIKWVIEVNGDQHWYGGSHRQEDSEQIYRDAFKYVTWMSCGIDVITMSRSVTSKESEVAKLLDTIG